MYGHVSIYPFVAPSMAQKSRLQKELGFQWQHGRADMRGQVKPWAAGQRRERHGKGVGKNGRFLQFLQCEAPKIAKLVYNSNNYGLWYL